MNARARSVLHRDGWNPRFAQTSPMFAPYAALAGHWHALERFPALPEAQLAWSTSGAHRLMQAGAPLALEHAGSAKAIEYERRVVDEGRLGLREGNWHDLMNLLVWCRFPLAKLALSRGHLQAAAQAAPGASPAGTRGARRDALTLLDESGLLLLCADAGLGRLLRERQWCELFEQRRAQVRAGMRFIIFGHGLLERARHPFPGLTGRTLVLDDVNAEAIAALDAASVAHAPHTPHAPLWNELDQRAAAAIDRLTTPAQLVPMPVLGVPGWWPDNETPGFYRDARQFRPPRVRA